MAPASPHPARLGLASLRRGHPALHSQSVRPLHSVRDGHLHGPAGALGEEGQSGWGLRQNGATQAVVTVEAAVDEGAMWRRRMEAPGADGQLVNARRGSSPQAQSTGGETAGQHRWVQQLSEDTNKVEMVKAMGHGAGKGWAKYGRTETRLADEAGGVRGVSVPLSGPGEGTGPIPRPRRVEPRGTLLLQGSSDPLRGGEVSWALWESGPRVSQQLQGPASVQSGRDKEERGPPGGGTVGTVHIQWEWGHTAISWE